MNDIRKALEQSIEASRLFEEKPTLTNAVKSCEANRRTMLLLFLARFGHNDQENLDKFKDIVRKLLKAKKERANQFTDSNAQRQLLSILVKLLFVSIILENWRKRYFFFLFFWHEQFIYNSYTILKRPFFEGDQFAC